MRFGNPRNGAEPAALDPWEELEAEAAKWKEISLRTAAEMDNLRKRTAREREDAVRFANQRLLEDLLPVISFNTKGSGEEQKKHQDFVNRMITKGYTEKQVRLLCEWYLRVRKSS